MKISTKGRYGLRILLDMALHGNATPRLARDIAESQQISDKYIARLVMKLRKGGFLRSVRGAKGGFLLARKPMEINLLDVVEAMEGPLSIVDCVERPAQCNRNSTCVTREIWNRLNAEFRESMRQITLQEIIDNYQQNNAENGAIDYCI